MARLIDADRAMEVVRNQGIAHPNAYHLTNYATLILREAPSVDAVEVVHGRWIEYQIPHVICCSNCDWATEVVEKNFQYCPMCGTQMDGGDGDAAD